MNTPTRAVEQEPKDVKEDEEEDEKELPVDLELLRDCFTPGTAGEVPLASFVKGFHEIFNFFKILGPIFDFVREDAMRKVAVLDEKMTGENSQYYVDLRTMINFETEQGIVLQNSPFSGMHAFVHLHRAMEFACGSIGIMMEEEEEPKLGEALSKLYLSTAGKFHPPMITRIVTGILVLLPDRATIRDKFTKGKEEAKETLRRLVPEVLKSMTKTYEAAELCLSIEK